MYDEKVDDFILAYHEWLQKGAPDNEPFSKFRGLCLNMLTSNYSTNLKALTKLWGGSATPFNDRNTFNSYGREALCGTCHLNPQRIAFVEEQVRRIHEQRRDS